jgi:hypothetical protein
MPVNGEKVGYNVCLSTSGAGAPSSRSPGPLATTSCGVTILYAIYREKKRQTVIVFSAAEVYVQLLNTNLYHQLGDRADEQNISCKAREVHRGQGGNETGCLLPYAHRRF